MDVLNSFNNILCLGFLTQFYFAVSQEMFTIIRTPGNGDPWTDLDEFKLPDSKCDVDCSVWNVYSIAKENCHCQCSHHQEATFGFYSGSWKCLANTEVRRQAGCNYEFSSVPDSTYPPMIIEKGEQEHNAILPSSGCSVDQAKSRYFRCDGRWAGIQSQSFSPQWFSIRYIRRLSTKRHRYRVTIGSGISAALLGRIISLNITCPQESSCLLFKLQGEFQCAENVTFLKPSPSSAILSPTTTPATAPATAPAATSDPNTTVANLNDKGDKEKAKSSGGSSTVVGVVVTLVILVVIVIVLAAYVYRKRKRGESIWLVDYISSRVVRNTRSTQPKKKTAEETQEDPEYAEIPEEQRRNEPVDQPGGIYSYAFDDPQTAYSAPQQAPHNRLVHNPRGPEEEGAIYSTADDGPVYNVLERLPAENQIMMAPESTMNEGPLSQVFEPEYLVLEGPDTTEETTDASFNTDVIASVGPANPVGPQSGSVAPKERRRPPSPLSLGIHLSCFDRHKDPSWKTLRSFISRCVLYWWQLYATNFS